jgi:hypothetical protein
MRVEQVKTGHDGRDLGEGVLHAAEFARVAQAVLEAAEDARDVADLVEQFAQFGEVARLGDEFADDGLAADDLRQVEGGGGEPAFEQARAGGGVPRSMAPSSEASRVPRMDANISRLRSVAGSSRSVRVLRYSWRERRFCGLAQRFSVA